MIDKASDSLFHYTGINAVASILQGGKLWLTHMSFLNDYNELRDGVLFIVEAVKALELGGIEEATKKRAIEFIKGNLDRYMRSSLEKRPLFTCSFSQADNLLSQWCGYGGFAIEFSRAKLLCQYDYMCDCLYDDKEKHRRAHDIVRDAVFLVETSIEGNGIIGPDGLSALHQLMHAAAQFKHKGFYEEREVRIVHEWCPLYAGIKYRPRGSCLVPYVEAEFDIGAIKAVHVGPVANKDLAEFSLNSLLKTCGLENIKVIVSDISFRTIK